MEKREEIDMKLRAFHEPDLQQKGLVIPPKILGWEIQDKREQRDGENEN